MGGFENLLSYKRKFDSDLADAVAQQLTGDKKQIVLAAMPALIEGTPVDTGETRQGWHLSAGTPTNENRRGKDWASDLATILANKTNALDPLYIQNNSPAAPILEYGLFIPRDPGPSKDPRRGRKGRILVRGGFSTQAPQGIMGDVVASLAARFGIPSF